jgi:hypothetical protein
LLASLIELAVLRLQSPITQEAIEKAEKAYEVMSFERGCQTFSGRTDYTQRCFSHLQINEALNG